MCITRLPEPKQRKKQIKEIRDIKFKSLVTSCVEREPMRRPNMEEVIESLGEEEEEEEGRRGGEQQKQQQRDFQIRHDSDGEFTSTEEEEEQQQQQQQDSDTMSCSLQRRTCTRRSLRLCVQGRKMY